MLGIITALPIEARCFLNADFQKKRKLRAQALQPERILKFNDQQLLYISGMGAERASLGAKALINAGATALLSWGTAGGLAPELRAGDVVIPQEILHYERGHRQTLTLDWHQQLCTQARLLMRVHSGLLAHSQKTLHYPHEKQVWFTTQGAIAVDMETWALAEIATNQNIPFACMRVIVDSADFCLPSAAIRSMSPMGQIRWITFLAHLVRHPHEIPALYRLARFFRQTEHSLRQLAKIDLLPTKI